MGGQVIAVNQSKLRKNPDPWHDVVIPGLDGKDAVPTVPGQTAEAPLAWATFDAFESYLPALWVSDKNG